MTRETPARHARPLLASLTVQFLSLILVSGGAPLLIAYARYGRTASPDGSIENSMLASVLAAVAALLLFRRVTAFPGTRGFAYIIPTYSITFGIAIALLLWLRVSYVSSMLAAGYAAALVFGFVVNHVIQRRTRRHFFLVPFGNTGIARETSDVSWTMLAEPELPRDEANSPIVADLRHDLSPAWERMLAAAAISGRPVYHTKQLRESLTGKVEIEHLSENSFGSLIPNLAYRKAKRATDVLLALAALPLLALPLLIVALAIKLDSPGPALFRQQRMGYGGRPFVVIKFRTMIHRPMVEGGEAARDHTITQDGDGRVTRIGRFLRRTRIDELPQLVNILRGEMSLIGPRPEAMPLSEWYEQELPFYVYRHIVRPGITGWAQVNQGHVADLDAVNTKLHYDFYYIKHFSAWIDFLILLRTIGIVFSGFGSK